MKHRLAFTALAASILTACATTPTGRGGEIASQAADAAREIRSEGSISTPFFVEHDRMWVGSQQIDQIEDRNLPATFSSRVIFRRAVPVTLNQVAEYIQSNYAVPVVVTQDAIDAAAGIVRDPVASAARQNANRLNAATTAAQLQAGVPQPGQQQTQIQPPQLAQNLGGQDQAGEFFLSFEGDLKGMLDRATAATGNSWKYERGRVTIFNVDTRTFSLSILPGSTSISQTISNQSQGGGGGGEGGASSATAGSSVTMDTEIDQFSSAITSIESMLSPRGRVVAAEGLNQVSVTDVPAVLDRVEDFVNGINDFATRQVVLQVQVFAVESNRENSTGIRWDAVWESVRESAGLTGASSASDQSNSLSYQIIDSSSRFNGSQVVIDALSRQANLEELTSVTQATLNGRVVPLSTGEEFAFVESVETTLVPDVGAQTTRELGYRTTGFNMTALPIITGGDKVLLRLQATLRTLAELRRIGDAEDGGGQEAPITDSRQFANEVMLRNGQTLIITGLEQEQFRSDLRGVGNPGFQLLGGGTNKSRAKTTIVIMVTPRIVD